MDNSARKDEIAKLREAAVDFALASRENLPDSWGGLRDCIRIAVDKALASYEEERPADELKARQSGEGWQPIETLKDHDTPVWLWTPASRLGSGPAVKNDMRVSARRYWTWATMWQPCAVPTPPDGQLAKDATPPASRGEGARESDLKGDR
jgi:hypothetical protein